MIKKNHQSDLDGDGLGDSCDYDIDGDSLNNKEEIKKETNPFYPYDIISTNAKDKDYDGVFNINNKPIYRSNCLEVCNNSFSASQIHNYNSSYSLSQAKSQYQDWKTSDDWENEYYSNGDIYKEGILSYLNKFQKNTQSIPNSSIQCEYICTENITDNCDNIANVPETANISPIFTATSDENGIGGALNMAQTKNSVVKLNDKIIWQADHDLDGIGNICDTYWKFIDFSIDKAFYIDTVIQSTINKYKLGGVELKEYDVKHNSYKLFLLSLIGADTDTDIIDTSMYFCYCETGNCENDCSKENTHASDDNFSRWYKMTPANIEENTLGIVEYEMDSRSYRGENESIYAWDWRKDLESWYLSNKNETKIIEFCEEDVCPKYKFVVSVGVNKDDESFTKNNNGIIARNPQYFYNDWRQLYKEGKQFSTAKYANAVRASEFTVSYEKKHVVKRVSVDLYKELDRDIEIVDGVIVEKEVITEDKIIQNPTETKIIKSGVNLSQPTIAKPAIKF